MIFSQSTLAFEDIEKYKLYKFTYTDADDCSCFVQPNICAGGFYLRNVERRINYIWNPPAQTTDETAEVQFKIRKNGSVSDIKLISKSDSPYSKSVIKAVEEAAPFHHLPDGAPSDVDIKMVFPTKVQVLKRLYNFDSKKPAEYEFVPYTSVKKPDMNYLDFVLAPHLMNLQDTILRNYNLRNIGSYGKVFSFEFTMKPDGVLCNFVPDQVQTLSERELLEIVKNSSPVDLAPGLPGELRIKFSFDPKVREPHISEARLIQP